MKGEENNTKHVVTYVQRLYILQHQQVTRNSVCVKFIVMKATAKHEAKTAAAATKNM